MSARRWIVVPMLSLVTPIATHARTPPRVLSASPGLSGGEGGNSGPVTVTLEPATKADPYLKTIVGQPRAAPIGDDPGTRCVLLAYKDMSTVRNAPTQMMTADVKPTTDGTPTVCEVTGFVAPQVFFQMWLPIERWNGKYMQVGCGGRCGKLLPDGCIVQVRRGYACLAHDLGHRGTTYDNIWAIDDVPSQIDFGFRATHVASIIGKALVALYYGKQPAHSYFVGASTGGRQALIAVQRFPKDFDGVVGGVALARVPGIDPNEPFNPGGRLLFQNGKAVLTATELRMLHKAVQAKCDALDGLTDGIVTDSRACPFQPVSLLCKGANTSTCLTPKQIATLDAIYATGTQRGSEIGWIGAYVAEDGSAGRYIPRNVGNTYENPYQWVFDDSSNPDIRPFQNAGGKFILYGGWADEVVNPLAIAGYYDSVENLIGSRAETQKFFRTFMVPGQSHIPGNIGAESINYVYALEDWVERGKAPDVLIGRKLKTIKQMLGPIVLDSDLVPANFLYSRPHYPYPIQARYRGQGDVDDAASFGPWDPGKRTWVK